MPSPRVASPLPPPPSHIIHVPADWLEPLPYRADHLLRCLRCRRLVDVDADYYDTAAAYAAGREPHPVTHAPPCRGRLVLPTGAAAPAG